MPNGTYGGVRGKGAQTKRSRSPTYSIKGSCKKTLSLLDGGLSVFMV